MDKLNLLGDFNPKEGDNMSSSDVIALIMLIICIIAFLDDRYDRRKK